MLLLLAILVAWMFQGGEIYTKDKRQIITKTKDEIFGTETEKVEWVDDFRLGLLPGGDSIGSVLLCVTVPGGILVAVAVAAFTAGRQARRNPIISKTLTSK